MMFTWLYTYGVLRVDDEVRERVQQLARDEFGGASANETIRRLLDEHWEAAALKAVAEYRRDNPENWARYVAEAEELALADAPIIDGWHSE